MAAMAGFATEATEGAESAEAPAVTAVSPVPFEVKDAATKALQKGCRPLPSHARRQDAETLESLIGRAKSSEVDEALISKAEKQLQSWWAQVERHEALDVLNQAFFRMDSDGDGYIDRDEWSHVIVRLEGPTWTKKELEDLFVRMDRKPDRRLDREEFVSRLLEGDTQSHKLVKEIVLTPPTREDGLLGHFGPVLLKGTAYKEFPIDTTEALHDAALIGIIVMTSSSVDQQVYPSSLLQLNKELLRRVAQLYLDLRDPEIEDKPTEKFEVVLCSFDTTWDAFTRTVGRPAPPAPWMVMPFDSPWQRDHLWRTLSVRFRHRSDPALVILKPNLDIITVKGFLDLDVPRKLLLRVFSEWLAEANGHSEDG